MRYEAFGVIAFLGKRCTMRFAVLSVSLLLLSVMRLSACEPGTTDTSDADLAAQIKAVNDKIEELRVRQSTLAEEQKRREEQKAARLRQEELARQQKEEAEKKLHFAKVEIRGKLIMTQVVQPYTYGVPQTSVQAPATDWYINMNELAWKLKLPDDAELLARAQKLVGKNVIVTGTVVLVKSPTVPTYPQPYQVIPYAPGSPVVPTPTQEPSIDPGFTPLQYPNGNGAGPGGANPNLRLIYMPATEQPVTIKVETLKAAE
jgi:hypothetical protein